MIFYIPSRLFLRIVYGALIVLGAFHVVFPEVLYAHNSGASLEKSVPPYIVDIGYDPVSPVAGDRLLFDFTLVDTASTSIPFDYVWVRIEKDKRTILATGITKAEYGPTSLLFAIPDDLSGELKLFARYQRDDDALAEADFTMMVAPKKTPISAYVPLGVATVVGCVLGIGATGVLMRRRFPLTKV